MNRIPPDRATPAVLLTDGPDTTATAHAHGWNITATIDTGRAARLTHAMTGSRRALIWHGRGWTISLPLTAPDTPTRHLPADAQEEHPTAGRIGTRADLPARWRSTTQAATRRSQPDTEQQGKEPSS